MLNFSMVNTQESLFLFSVMWDPFCAYRSSCWYPAACCARAFTYPVANSWYFTSKREVTENLLVWVEEQKYWEAYCMHKNSFLMLCMTTRAEDAPQNFPATMTGPVGLFVRIFFFFLPFFLFYKVELPLRSGRFLRSGMRSTPSL